MRINFGRDLSFDIKVNTTTRKQRIMDVDQPRAQVQPVERTGRRTGVHYRARSKPDPAYR